MPRTLLPAIALIAVCFAIPLGIGALLSGGDDDGATTVRQGSPITTRTVTTQSLPPLRDAPEIRRPRASTPTTTQTTQTSVPTSTNEATP